MPVRSTLSDTSEDRTSEYTPCRSVPQQVIGSASQPSTCHSSSQELIIVIEEGREYYVPSSTRKKRTTTHVGTDTFPTDNGSRQSVMDLRPQAHSTTKVDETMSQDRTRSMEVTDKSLDSSAVKPRIEPGQTYDHSAQRLCPFLTDIGVSMNGTPRSSTSSSLPLPAMPIDGPVDVERMMPQHPPHPTRINQYTSDPIDAANMEPAFRTYLFSATTNPSGQAPIHNNVHNHGGFVGPPFFTPASAGDLQAHGGGFADMQSAPQGIRPLDDRLITPASFSHLVPLDFCACGIVFDTQRRGALGRLWQPLVDTLCDRSHLIYMLTPLGGTQPSSMDHYGAFNVMPPSTAYSGFAGG
ncbi:hypothetical protein BD410DRAFT_807741 [Rickenella mellea]|uniref:Uncharacterized protein n=1 Tax=Rickenella mellea TaxID=50990 RepID=A0A4Y7PPI0_9AGAM|nr:hypothetical protein BD410DRAFT_807741 [Rickenella mellea]